MGKLKKYFAGGVAIFACLILTACNLFGTKVEKLEIEYTPDAQFFIGENWVDDTIEATAFFSDDSKKDVTSELEIDKSDFDNTKLGTYEIKFKYEELELGIDVHVVSTMTNKASIHRVAEPLFKSAFKETNGALEFKAGYMEAYPETNGVFLFQELNYKVLNGTVKQYYSIFLADENQTEVVMLAELLYDGGKAYGTGTNKIYDLENPALTETNVGQIGINDFNTAITTLANLFGTSNALSANEFLDFYNTYYETALLSAQTFEKSLNNYTLTLSNGVVLKINSSGFVSQFGDVTFEPYSEIPNYL